jgi:hypothetical protein
MLNQERLEELSSWGRRPRSAAWVHQPADRHALQTAVRELPSPRGLLARGLGRSYNDAPLNAGGIVLRTSGLSQIRAFPAPRGEDEMTTVFVVMAVATDQRAPAAIAPIAVGFALAVGVFIAGPVTGGSVNPARSLGPMIVAGDLTSFWLYILGPIIGGVLGALLYDRTMAQTQGPA